MREIMELVVLVIIVFVFIAAPLIIGANYYSEYKCGAYSQITGRDTKWAPFDDCYINDGKNWLSKKEYAAVIIAREGLSK